MMKYVIISYVLVDRSSEKEEINKGILLSRFRRGKRTEERKFMAKIKNKVCHGLNSDSPGR